jgi:ribosome biogenesis GTPase
MSKKKLNIQQKNRILKKQLNYSPNDCLEGLVVTRTQNKALIESDKGDLTLSSIRPDLESLVVGDRVLWARDAEAQGVVMSVLPRQTELGRTDRYHHYKILAANITQMVVVIAPKPEPQTLLLDSYCVAAELNGLKLSIVFNKTDLDKEHEFQKVLQNAYHPLCRAFIENSIKNPNLTGFETILKNEVSIFVGQSGVGKSTLINFLLPEQSIATSPLSNTHEFGQHTTSSSYYYHLPFSGAIIDSPGVRSFGLTQLNPIDLLWGFKEFRPYIGQCKFRDCQHEHDANCAILLALKNQRISQKRYENYVKLKTQFCA